jgi:hypothetical protein
VAWSEPSPAGYRLVVYHDGIIRTLPVAPSTIPFDVDLGPDRRGRVAAVYQRCTGAPSPIDLRAPLGCDLYVYDFRRVREMPVRRANTQGNDELYPAIWRGRLVFARPWGFYWRSLTGRGHSRRLGNAPEGYFPRGADLRGKLAALSFVDTVDSGELDLVQIGGRTRTIPLDPVADASIGRRFVYWGAWGGDRYYGNYQVLARYDRVRESYETAHIPFLSRAIPFARDDATSYYLAAEHPPCYDPSSCGPYDLHRQTDLRFGVP